MDTKVVDSHQHFWDINRFYYWWLTPDREILNRNFYPQDLEPFLAPNGVQLTVAVQAHASLEEAFWLLELAEKNDFIAGVVGWVDLTSRHLAYDLNQLQRHPKFKGVRSPLEAKVDDAWMLHKDVVEGLHELECRNIPFDLVIYPRHLKYLLRLREKCPRLRMVIDHIALPPIAEKRMDGWDRDIEAVSKLPDLWCKLSGMITGANPQSWKPGDLKPYVNHVVKLFGYERLMFGTDWPICTLAGSYGQVVDALHEVLGSLSAKDSAAVWGGNAREFYSLR